MQVEDTILKSEERVIMGLRNIYRMHGYSCFKMNKFEEYDLYSRNKEFLVSDSVITFTDTNGKLMALKPDVTLSIVKNYHGTGDGVQRLFYNENVYRVSESTHNYRESMQMGVECIGDITEYNLYEVITLAAASLGSISKRCVLNISSLDILSVLFENVGSEQGKAELFACIGEKNAHGIYEICKKYEVDEETADFLAALVGAYGDAKEVVSDIRKRTENERILAALGQLERVAQQVQEMTDIRVRVDLSLTNDINYYNGLVFQGFVEEIPTRVLSGGQYDRLMEKMGKHAKAVGFAVYLDLLERLNTNDSYDVDVLLLYRKGDDFGKLQRCAQQLMAEGKSVSVQTEVPAKLLYRETVYFDERETGGKEDE